ncbi:hypothetical protein SAMN04489712_109173 [Thermomonospora echinospora]|uniref:Uncharacterized protein n=2 Tax=Thermomonospora echinospora TaxID=1992 RepID=A0A1H6CCH9_9ACTN|nr:hypothetical protein SAMN04489712_109173 [Thermomonospora echinospora]
MSPLERGLTIRLLAVRVRAEAVLKAGPSGHERALAEDAVRLVEAVTNLLETRDDLRREAREQRETAARWKLRRCGRRKAAFCLGTAMAYHRAADRLNAALADALELRTGPGPGAGEPHGRSVP